MMTTRLAIQARKILFCDTTGQGIGIDNITKKMIEGQMSSMDNIKEKLKMAKDAAFGQVGRMF